MKPCCLLLLFLVALQLQAQKPDMTIDSIIKTDYIKNGQIKDSCIVIKGIHIGIRKVYDKNGRLWSVINYGDYKLPRTIATKTFFFKGSARMNVGNYIQTSANYLTKNGAWKWYWKNGSVMDSIIFKNDHELFRARFSKSGKLQFTEKYPENAKDGDPVKITGYNNNGSVKYNRTQIKGKNGY
jgi:antitoxin component YwqK of YwqJK toxin-antitoxin module